MAQETETAAFLVLKTLCRSHYLNGRGYIGRETLVENLGRLNQAIEVQAFQTAVDVLLKERYVSSKLSEKGIELLKVSRSGWDHYKVIRGHFHRKARIWRTIAVVVGVLIIGCVLFYFRAR